MPQHSPAERNKTNFTLFEAAAVRPIAVLPSGLVAVTNIPDDRVELFRPHRRGGVKHCGSVKVGMRPVALSAVGEDLWVVNHLSDSVSVVKLDTRRCRGVIVQSLRVGDEPRDIVVASNAGGKRYVFVTAAHRGQNVLSADGSHLDPKLTTAGMGRADVFVFDTQAPGMAGGGQLVDILTLFTDSPRALAVGDNAVYAAGFMSGNQTSIVRYQRVIKRGRESLARLDKDGDQVIDADLPAEQRIIHGGYPAIRGHGRCIAAGTTTPPRLRRNDFMMDVCVRTDPEDPYRALEIVKQTSSQATPACSCTNVSGELQRTPPLIVRFRNGQAACGQHYDADIGGCWLEPPVDENAPAFLAQAWNDDVALALPDRDVFTIDMSQSQSEPTLMPAGVFQGVGTTLFNMAVHPKNGKIFVSNTEARNHIRFEGPGPGVSQRERYANTTVRGHIAESRITVLDPANGSVKPVHLNEHIDYSHCCEPAPNAESDQSLAFPLGMVISQQRDKNGQLLDEQDLYVSAIGSDKVAVLSTSKLEHAGAGEIVQTRADHIDVAGGPTGLALDPQRGVLYVLARFTNELVVVDTAKRAVRQRLAMFTPEPASVIAGRPALYDARRTSSHGDSACFSCHLFGDLDSLSWDLGAPNEKEFKNTGPIFAKPEITSAPLNSHFLPVKGPMTTQSMRGLANHGAMHWRGDRRGGRDSEQHRQPDTGAFDERAAFEAFNIAFAGLNGRADVLPQKEMAAFTDFALQLTYPPNPNRALDNSLDAGQRRARSRYFGCEISDESMSVGECADGRNIAEETFQCNCLNPPRFVLGIEQRPDYCPPEPRCTLDVSDLQNTCNGCHTLDPAGNAEYGVAKPGFFGTSGVYTNDGVAHILKIPHLRNLYQKVGMFGSVLTRPGIGLTRVGDSVFGTGKGGLVTTLKAQPEEQIRGFGFTHAGEEDTLLHFFSLTGFSRRAAPGGPYINDNSAGFERALPRDSADCFDHQLPELNQRFLAELAAPGKIEHLRELLQVANDPSIPEEEANAAYEALVDFLFNLDSTNPGSVFQRLTEENAVDRLALPLLACPPLPDETTLQSHGCFELKTGQGCNGLIADVRACARWGSTLEQLFASESRACEASGIQDMRDMESFVFAFDSNLKPVVGQQVTFSAQSDWHSAWQRLLLLKQQADVRHCDLIAHDARHGYVYEDGGFLRDDGRRFDIFPKHLQAITFTCVPPGEGRRSGVDRDEDGILDGMDFWERRN